MPVDKIKEKHFHLIINLNRKADRIGFLTNTAISNHAYSSCMIRVVLKGYSEGADEENRTQESSQDGEPLSRSQLLTEHLHASKYQH